MRGCRYRLHAGNGTDLLEQRVPIARMRVAGPAIHAERDEPVGLEAQLISRSHPNEGAEEEPRTREQHDRHRHLPAHEGGAEKRCLLGERTCGALQALPRSALGQA